MLFKDKTFVTMQSGLDALWLKQRVISNNIANYETPGYKAQKVTFQEVLTSQMMDGKEKQVPQFRAVVSTDTTTSARVDGNNVDLDQETLELWQAYAQYTYLSEKVSNQFSNIRYVINSFK